MSESTDHSRRALGHVPALVRLLLTTVIVLGADLYVKAWSFRTVAGYPVDASMGTMGVPPHEARPFVPGVLSLKLVVNEGAVFGLGQGQRWTFIAIGIVAFLAIGIAFARSGARHWVLHIGLALVLAGALGNFYDRATFGAVRDMCFLFPDATLPFGWTWPGGRNELYPWIFNIADVALLAGLGILVVVMFRAEHEAKKDEKAAKAKAEDESAGT